jgi:hypothetical protein
VSDSKSCAVPTSNVRCVHRLAASEDDDLDKLEPTIRYLQKLGRNYLDLIFVQSKWVFEANPKMASKVRRERIPARHAVQS